MKIYSWNVNGIRAAIKKGFWQWVKASDADIICIQETKAQEDQLAENDRLISPYQSFWNPARVKKGYSGTACFFLTPPLDFSTGLPNGKFGGEGRLIRLEYPDFHLFNIYFPNGKMNDERLTFKMGYYNAFLEYAEELRQKKPIIVCGDFNTAHKEIDLKNPKANAEVSGFLPQERAWLDCLVAHGYHDTFRLFHPEGDQYSWWSYRFGARERNAGWRIDYFFISDELRPRLKNAWIEQDVQGSDHCPVAIEIN